MIIEAFLDQDIGEVKIMDCEYSLEEHYFNWYGNYSDSEIENLLEGE